MSGCGNGAQSPVEANGIHFPAYPSVTEIPAFSLSSFLSQQREKRWSISSAGGEKNSSSVSRKELTETEWERESERGVKRGSTIALAFYPGIKLDPAIALTTLLLYKIFLLWHLACKLAPRLCFLY